eukprot:scaffold2267_cov92-Cylindrotheca_fusiformis.AAC.16
MTAATTQALSRVEQLLLQRLMAAHVLDDKDAKSILCEIQQQQQQLLTQDDNAATNANNNNASSSLEECFANINQQMTHGFGLEIATVVMDASTTKYHAVMNTHGGDDVSKKAFEKHFDAHDRQFILLILQHLVDATANDNDNKVVVVARRDLYNLRGELQEPYRMSLQGAEHVVESLIQQQWLRISSTTATTANKNKNNKKRNESSMQATLELAPRSYLELSHLLVEDMVFPQDDLPQFLFHKL